MSPSKARITAQDVAEIGMMTALIEVSKQALAFLPNVELVSFLIIVFTLIFGRKVIYSALAFIAIETCIYGVQTWVIMYLYIWPLLSLLAWLLRRQDNALLFALLSGFFGLAFGALCSIPYWFIGGPSMAFAWWIAGIPFDIVHGISNFILMLTLYRPVVVVIRRIRPARR